MHTGKGEPSVPAHLHITLPAPTQCRVCSDHFYTSDGLLFHQQRQCTLISFSCSACGSDFVSQVALAEHLHRLHSPSYYKCSACPMAFKTTGNFHKHQQQHLDADNKHCS
ncbi:hypothetical protein CAPTEDRAFT_134506, partial [Capitella teleta]